MRARPLPPLAHLQHSLHGRAVLLLRHVVHRHPGEHLDADDQVRIRRHPKLRRALGQLLHAPAQPPTAAEAAAAAVAVADGAADDEPAAGQPLLFLLPPPEHEAVTSQHLGYRAECEALRDRLLSSRRRPFAKPLSEREWLRGACRIMELIIASPRLAEYNRAQQKLHAYS